MERNRKIIALIDTREHDLWRHLSEDTSIIKVKPPSLLRCSTTAGSSPAPSRLNIREPGRVERTSLPVGDIWIVARRYLHTEGEDDDITEKEDAIKLTKAESEAMRRERERDRMQGKVGEGRQKKQYTPAKKVGK